MQETHGDDVDVVRERGQHAVEGLDLAALSIEATRHLVAQPRAGRGDPAGPTNGS